MMCRRSQRLLHLLALLLIKYSTQQDLEWFWDRNHYVPENISDGIGEERTLLVVQDSAFGAEEQVVDVTARVNRAYAKRWGYDYAKLVGVAIGKMPWERSFNKAYLLNEFVKARNEKGDFPVYNTIVMLDSNALIVDLDFDIMSLIPVNKLLSNGIRTEQDVKDMYSDVMLWNIDIPEAENIATKWMEAAQNVVGKNLAISSNDLLLQVIKKELSFHDRIELLQLIPKQFVNKLDGTIIKQDGTTVQDVVNISDLPIIIPTLQGIADSVCYRFYPQCEVIGNM